MKKKFSVKKLNLSEIGIKIYAPGNNQENETKKLHQ